ncbi:MAG: hypothetical protein QMD14_02910 [Candidatus Aenigmarchaeota archaeon]|nr:hypothetical protein [Candidatus Aenigmarchaeota archaeon]
MKIKLGVDYLERIRSNGSRVNLDDILEDVVMKITTVLVVSTQKMY